MWRHFTLCIVRRCVVCRPAGCEPVSEDSSRKDWYDIERTTMERQRATNSRRRWQLPQPASCGLVPARWDDSLACHLSTSTVAESNQETGPRTPSGAGKPRLAEIPGDEVTGKHREKSWRRIGRQWSAQRARHWQTTTSRGQKTRWSRSSSRISRPRLGRVSRCPDWLQTVVSSSATPTLSSRCTRISGGPRTLKREGEEGSTEAESSGAEQFCFTDSQRCLQFCT